MLRTTKQSAASPSSFWATKPDDSGMRHPEPGGSSASALIADADRFQRGPLVALLSSLGCAPVAEAGTAREALLLAHRLRPGLVLLGVRLPDDSGHRLVRALAEEHPGAVILVAGELSRSDTLEALAAGARGVISKQLDRDAFAAVVEAAMSDRAVLVPPEVGELLSSVLPASSDPSLSRRELEVLALVVRGRDNAAIAEQLHISPSTAKGHVSHILRKLQSENRIEAAVKGVRRGLVRP
jgi:DNA-binding NarL/FixJ family response regulator